METLKNYLTGASHYLTPDSSIGGAERQRKDFLDKCQRLGVEKSFPDLVAKDSEWRELAKSKKVYFFEDFVKDPLGREVKPEIRLLCTEMGTVPVIKLVHEKD
ncbi:MAG: hypothetical protein IJ223_03355 [Clostridia bacterium]|nr:hypothetical protein [Clostridia bacterium]